MQFAVYITYRMHARKYKRLQSDQLNMNIEKILEIFAFYTFQKLYFFQCLSNWVGKYLRMLSAYTMTCLSVTLLKLWSVHSVQFPY